MGSPVVASLVVHLVFWRLVMRELPRRGAAPFVAVWFLSMAGLGYVPYGAPLFPSIVAVLVFIVFKGYVRLT